ncbi:MAG TPA: hypothetical protein VIL32_05100 [Steroidobacteraceae bacterium]
MGRFEEDIDRINHMVDELEEDLDRTTQRIEMCVDQLDQLSQKIARASKTLREELALQRAHSLAASSNPALQ